MPTPPEPAALAVAPGGTAAPEEGAGGRATHPACYGATEVEFDGAWYGAKVLRVASGVRVRYDDGSTELFPEADLASRVRGPGLTVLMVSSEATKRARRPPRPLQQWQQALPLEPRQEPPEAHLRGAFPGASPGTLTGAPPGVSPQLNVAFRVPLGGNGAADRGDGAGWPQPTDGSDDVGGAAMEVEDTPRVAEAADAEAAADDDDDAGAGIDDDGDDDADVPLAAAGGACAHDAAAPGGGTGGEGSEGQGDWTTDDDDDVPLKGRA